MHQNDKFPIYKMLILSSISSFHIPKVKTTNRHKQIGPINGLKRCPQGKSVVAVVLRTGAAHPCPEIDWCVRTRRTRTSCAPAKDNFDKKLS